MKRQALALSVLHTGLALVCWFLGVRILREGGGGPWDWYWQHLPLELLRDRPIETLWYMHAQPPLWNALGAVFALLVGPAHVLAAVHAFNVACGALLTALSALLAAELSGRPRVGVAVGALVAAHPALLLLEAYALYPVLAATLLVLVAYTFVRRWHVAAVGFAALLTLTRSLFHPVFILPLLPVAWLRATPRARAAIVVLALLPFAWSAKNLVQHGFFGTSSWYGMGLWRVAVTGQPVDAVNALLRAGAVPPEVTVPPFSPPSAYHGLGHTLESPVPSLARDDLHNVNVPHVSSAYQRAALTVIRERPAGYLKNVAAAYSRFTAPSTTYLHLLPNRDEILPLAAAYETLLGRPALRVPRDTTLAGAGGSLYLLLIPAAVLATLYRRPRDPATMFLVGAIAYVTIVGCTMELGENVRFKFLIEPVLFVLVGAQARKG